MSEPEIIELETEGLEEHRAIARDDSMEDLLRLARNVAETPSTVLLRGESGVGKEVVARYIHRHSPRSESLFVAVNCAALPTSLLESELFGHEKGSFSGATSRHIGYFERAQGGTILLDEVSEISPQTQAKLLRVLQERTLMRVGGSEPIQFDARVLATTNRDLKKCVDEGSFRLDLFYRLNVFPLEIPPLRERPGDIGALTSYYLGKFSKRMGRDLEGITRRAMDRLLAYPFPGNVRELINILERAVILAGGGDVVDVDHLILDDTVEIAPSEPLEFGSVGLSEATETEVEDAVQFRPGEEPLTDIRRKVILSTLSHFNGNQTRTAEALGVSRRTVSNRLNKYRELGIVIPDKDKDDS